MNLVIDPFQSYPSIFTIFDKNIDYYCLFKEERIGVPNTQSEFISKYGFNPKTLGDILAKEYDNIFYVIAVWDFDRKISGDRAGLSYNNYINTYSDIIRRVKYNKVIIMDNSDYPDDPTKLLTENYDLILKREYVSYLIYDKKVKPYPYFTFGQKDPMWDLLNNWKTNWQTSNDIFWAGTTLDALDLEKMYLARREWFVSNLGDCVKVYKALPYEQYMDTMQTHKYFLSLRGVGQTCNRMFEGMSRSSVLIQETMEIVWPNGEEFIYFNDPYTLKKWWKDGYFDKHYHEFFERQNTTIESFINNKWLRHTIERNL